VPGAVDVLCDAFAHYPVMHFVLGPARAEYSEHLRLFCQFAVMSRVYRREFILGIADGGMLQGVATVSRPAVSASSPELKLLREETWNRLGSAARVRYEEYSSAIARFIPAETHLHLNMLGVRHAAHGKGYARTLLEAVHALSREDATSSGVSLTTEVEANVSLYERFGYRLLGRIEFAPRFSAWGFFRANSLS
jgi:GNAT superfamily N-acetyltransferase